MEDTVKLTKNQQLRYDLIPHGEDNAILREDLVSKTDMSDRKIRDLIAEVVELGFMVCSSTSHPGYWKPTKVSELVDLDKQTESYIKRLGKKRKAIKKYLSVHVDQLEM